LSKRILYLQYTNPAAYPPLQHSASMLAGQGWDVLFLGIAARGAATLLMPEHPGIRVHRIGAASGGALGTLKYVQFAARSIAAAARFRPHWVYASDALSAPAALAVRDIVNSAVLYHEHDAPTHTSALTSRARARLATTAELVVAPAAGRLEVVPAGPGQRFVVWNCPRREEMKLFANAPEDERFRLVYHGSLSRDRLLPQFIEALALLPAQVQLDIFGYETAGHRGYVTELMQRAAAHHVQERVHYHGPIDDRAELLQRVHGHQLGIATVAPKATDFNLATLAGASNKAFEYLGCGLPILVSRAEAWRTMFERPGYAVSCRPDDAHSIADAVLPLVNNPMTARRMGQAGHERVLREWNYETQFAPVLAALSA
jgi:glycosyltransferase involved in cell wall biosynthesis